MKRLVLGLLISFSSLSAQAEGGWFMGINSTNFSSSTSGISFSNTLGFEGGYTKILDIGLDVYIRTGIGGAYRGAEYEIGTTKWELSILMLEVPITLLYDFGDIIAGFAGFNANYAASTSCKSSVGICTTNESIEDFSSTFVAGLNIAMTSNHMVELYFEAGMGEIAPDLEYSTFGTRYVYMFN